MSCYTCRFSRIEEVFPDPSPLCEGTNKTVVALTVGGSCLMLFNLCGFILLTPFINNCFLHSKHYFLFFTSLTQKEKQEVGGQIVLGKKENKDSMWLWVSSLKGQRLLWILQGMTVPGFILHKWHKSDFLDMSLIGWLDLGFNHNHNNNNNNNNKCLFKCVMEKYSAVETGCWASSMLYNSTCKTEKHGKQTVPGT